MTEARHRWNTRYRASEPAAADVAPFVVAVADRLPPACSVVDIGGGLGRNARWLAHRGHQVTLVDASDVGLAQAAELAPDGMGIEYVCRDVEIDGLPPGRSWDAALMHLYFSAAVLASLPAHLQPGGLVLVCQPTTTNLERHRRPNPRFLLAPGELESIAEAIEGIEILETSEGWRASGRHDAWLVARRI